MRPTWRRLPCPAIPTTSVAKMSGAMIDRMSRRKIVLNGLSDAAAPGASQPTTSPAAMPTKIHCVSVVRGNFTSLLPLRVCPQFRQDAVTAPVPEVDGEPEEEPDDQPPPVLRRKREHEEEARDDPGDRDERDEGRPEGALGVRIGPPHDEDRRADDDEGEERADVRQLGQDPE